MKERASARLLSLAPLKRGALLVWETSPRWTVVQGAVLVLQGLVPLATLWLMKEIVDAVTAAIGGSGAARTVFVLIGLAAGVAVLGLALRTLGLLVNEVQALGMGDRVFDVLHEKSVRVDLEYYESAHHLDTLHRAQAEAPFRPARIVSEVAQVGLSAVSLVGVFGLLLSFNALIVVILLAAALPGIFVKMRFSHRLYDWAQRQTKNQRFARYFNTLLTSAEYAKEVRLFGLGRVFLERFRDVRARVRRDKLGLVARRSGWETLAQIVAAVAVFGAFAWIANETLAGAITLGEMIMYFGAFQRAQDFFRDLLAGIAGLYEDNLFLSDFETFLGLESAVPEPAEPVPFPRPLREGIVFENVSFRYPGSERSVLHDVSFEIRPGEHVALVGENGSGKTTLTKLLCRFYDPDGGSIRIGGVPLDRLPTDELRRELGVIFQDYARYHLTLRENIWLGDIRVPPTGDRVEEAARRTGAHNVASELPRGYDTELGRQLSEGSELSLGQWQKVALARAFLRDSQIIVLDEPTASLDPRSEAELFERFHELAAGRTAILISHRLSTVRMADRIIVLENGRIVEAGPHDDLVGQGGRYSELFELQARHYR
ncbi:MAG: ABC transporter ATP-binding protein [Gemmatimonadota bacterium]|jgi:ATP-binding cassette subfamily B protein